MDVTKFVDAIRLVVERSAAKECVESYDDPPGRKPSDGLIELSRWYKSLSGADKAMLEKALQDAVRASLFGMFCVLDGVRAIENPKERGEVELSYVKSGVRTRITDPNQNLLHDEYRADW